ITIEIAENVKFLPEEDPVRGAWEDLRNDPRAVPFRNSAPGPHVRCVLSGTLLRNGDPVAVAGKPVSEEMSGGGPRSAAEKKVTHARATVIAIGSNAIELLDEDQRPPPEPGIRPLGVPVKTVMFFFAAAIALGSIAASITYSPAMLDFGAYAALALALGMWFVATRLLVFRGRGGRVHARPFGPAAHVPFAGTAFFFVGMIALGDWPGHMLEGRQQNASHIVLGTVGCVAGLYLVGLLRSGWRSVRLARTLLAAPRGKTDGWASFEGTMRASRTKAAVFSLLEETWREGSGSNPKNERNHAEPFVLEGERELRVAPSDGACWATDHGFKVKDRATGVEKNVVLERWEIRPGARVLAAGYVQDGEMKATGAESLVLFASESGNPRASLRLRLVIWWLAAFLLVVLVAGCFWLAFAQPGMPPENVPDSN